MSVPFSAPINAPTTITATNTSGIGIPIFAKTPAATLHTANCDPTEMSISPTRMTTVIPMAMSSVETLLTARSRRLAALKKEGAAMPTNKRSTAKANAAANSRL